MQNIKIGMRKKSEYLWTLSNENLTVFWTNETSEEYLSRPTILMPKHLVNDKNTKKIIAPKKTAPQSFLKHGITYAGFSAKAKGYFHIFGKTNYTNFVLIESGAIRLRYANRISTLKAGDILLISHNLENVQISVERGKAVIFWCHFNDSWNGVLRDLNGVAYYPFEAASQILCLAHAYRDEIYLNNPSVAVCESCATAIAAVFRRHFAKKFGLAVSPDKFFDAHLNAIKNGKILPKSAKSFAKSLKKPSARLDKYCEKCNGKTLSKTLFETKMDRALRVLNSGKTVGEAAMGTGYASAFSFSRAFKRHFKIPPSEICKNKKQQ